MKVRIQTLLDALLSPPDSSSYRAIISLIGWETFQQLYDLKKLILSALQKYGLIYIFDDRYVTKLIKYGSYVDVDRVRVDVFFLTFLPALKRGEEIGMVEPHLWVLLERGEAKSYEVRNVADVKAVFAEIKRVVENDDEVKTAVLHIEARIRDLDEELLAIASDNIERGVAYLRGLIADTIAALMYNADKEVLHMFVKRLKERWGLLFEALSIKDLIAAEARAGNQAIVEVLKELDISPD